MRAVDRAVRRELDRLAGEILRREHHEGADVCLALYARRSRLLAVRNCAWRSLLELVK